MLSRMEISSFDSPPPLNINDADLHPNMTELPEQRIGLSETSFTVARCWMTDMWRTMIDIRRTDPNMGKSFVAMTLMEKEMWVDGQHDRLMQLLFGGKQSTEPLQSVWSPSSQFLSPLYSDLTLLLADSIVHRHRVLQSSPLHIQSPRCRDYPYRTAAPACPTKRCRLHVEFLPPSDKPARCSLDLAHTLF